MTSHFVLCSVSSLANKMQSDVLDRTGKTKNVIFVNKVHGGFFRRGQLRSGGKQVDTDAWFSPLRPLEARGMVIEEGSYL